MARVGETAGEEAVAQLICDRLRDDHRAERHVPRVDPLGDREDVRDDVPVVAGEPLAGAPEAGHHLVADQQDPVLVAGLADRLEVAVGRDDDPVRADDRLEDHRGDRLWSLVLEDLLEMRPAAADRARIRMAGGAAVGVGVEHSHDAGDARLGVPAAWVAGEGDRTGRRAVVAAIARDHLVASGHPARDLDRVLVRLGAAVREERHLQVAGRDLGEHSRQGRARLGGHRRPDRAELLGLLLDRRDHLRVPVADRDVDEL